MRFYSLLLISLCLVCCTACINSPGRTEREAGISSSNLRIDSIIEREFGVNRKKLSKPFSSIETPVAESLYVECLKIPSDVYSKQIVTSVPTQIYYYRSSCLSWLAVQSRNLEYCKGVRRARYLLYGGSYYTPENCRARVESAKRSDIAYREYLKNPDLYKPYEPVEIAVVPQTDGSYSVLVMIEGEMEGVYKASVYLAPLSINPENRKLHRGNIDGPDSPYFDTESKVYKGSVSKEIAVSPKYKEGFVVIASFRGPKSYQEVDYGSIIYHNKEPKALSLEYRLK